ncbi:unnamed protein product [Polarella glacialis]|uniref:Uncharacterized protein n=1 Tax=Polarella glacialis TaxID=89957 RepID=A0A813F273_POLGL|nr:unnamed protein product [Polarella glacialis]
MESCVAAPPSLSRSSSENGGVSSSRVASATQFQLARLQAQWQASGAASGGASAIAAAEPLLNELLGKLTGSAHAEAFTSIGHKAAAHVRFSREEWQLLLDLGTTAARMSCSAVAGRILQLVHSVVIAATAVPGCEECQEEPGAAVELICDYLDLILVPMVLRQMHLLIFFVFF